MFIRELKVNLKSALIWLGILAGIFFIILVAYPYIIDAENLSNIEAMMAMFPEEMLKAFNMDLAMIDTAYGWLKTEGFIFILLVLCCYAGILGSTIVLKEENDMTIEYLTMLPISRTKIVLSKALAGLIYVVAMVVAVSITNLVALFICGSFDVVQYILLSITPLYPCVVIYFMSMFISTFAHKSKAMLGVALGITFISYILNVLSTISSQVEFLKYFSVFTLADIRNVMINSAINPIMILLSIVLSGIMLVGAILRYNSKELV